MAASPPGEVSAPRAGVSSVDEYLDWLASDRRVQELQLTLAFLFGKVQSPLRAIRLEGLQSLAALMRGLKDFHLEAFLRLQQCREESVALYVMECVLLKATMNTHLENSEKSKHLLSHNGEVRSAEDQVSAEEIIAALDVMTGLCLLHFPSKRFCVSELHALDLCLSSLELLSGTVTLPPPHNSLLETHSSHNLHKPPIRSSFSNVFNFNSDGKRMQSTVADSIQDFRWALVCKVMPDKSPSTGAKSHRRTASANTEDSSSHSSTAVPTVTTTQYTHLLITLVDLLLALLVDSESNLREFSKKNGLQRIVAILRNKLVITELRAKISDMLVFLVRYFTHYKEENMKLLTDLIGAAAVDALIACIPIKYKPNKFESFLHTVDKSKH